MLPDNAGWHNPDGDWTGGLETFSRYNQVNTIIDYVYMSQT
jgi:hypothetical protein